VRIITSQCFGVFEHVLIEAILAQPESQPIVWRGKSPNHIFRFVTKGRGLIVGVNQVKRNCQAPIFPSPCHIYT
jgi:hypothetical protein